MTPLELQALITSDTEAASLLEQGKDAACAARCSVIAPLVRKETFLTERGMYAALGATVAETILLKLVAFANASQTASPIMARVLEWLKPNNGGVDFGLQQTVDFVAMLHQGEVEGVPVSLYRIAARAVIVLVAQVRSSASNTPRSLVLS